MLTTVQCGQCAKRYKVESSLAGKKLKCKACGGIIVIPVALDLEAPADDLLPPMPTAPARASAGPPPQPGHARTSPPPAVAPCPGCGKPLPAANRVCLSCGFNRTTGKKTARTLIGQAAAGEEPEIRPNPGYADPYLKLTDQWASVLLFIVGLGAVNWYWIHFLYQMFVTLGPSNWPDGGWKIVAVQTLVYMVYAAVILLGVMGLTVFLIQQAGAALKFSLPENAYRRMIAVMSLPLIVYYLCINYFTQWNLEAALHGTMTLRGTYQANTYNPDTILLVSLLESVGVAVVLVVPLFLFFYRLRRANFFFAAAVVFVMFSGGLIGDFYLQRLGDNTIVSSVAESVYKDNAAQRQQQMQQLRPPPQPRY